MIPRATSSLALPSSILGYLALLLTPILAQSTLPRIDFGSLGTVGVVGSFAGLSLYDAGSAGAKFNPAASALISRSATGNLTHVGATNDGGNIAALCQTPTGLLFVGGTFTSLGGQPAINIAAYDPAIDKFTALGAGLDGEVRALSCNGTTLYAGGDFQGPAGSAGNVAAWSIPNQSWSAVPFGGLNGVVETIAPSEDGRSLFFGGDFSTTFSNGTGISSSSSSSSDSTFKSLGSSLTPISLNTSDYVASPTTYISGFGRPEYIFCPSHGDGIGASWLLVDGAVGSFIARVYRPLQVRGIRLGNTFYEGRGTRNFSLTSIPDNTVLELTYASDPTDSSSPLTTCSANCELAHDPNVPYQDFLFPNNTVMTGFELNIFGWYGAGAGLHLLQLLSDGAYAYGVEANNIAPCSSGLGTTTQSKVSTTGAWNQTDVVSTIAGTYQPVLVAYIEGGTSAANAPTITWTPYVSQGGDYQIFLVTPGCQEQGTCAARTSVSVSVTPAGSSQATTTIVDQTNTAQASSLIYSGQLPASTDSAPGVSITLSLNSGGAPNVGTTYEVVADLVSLVAASTNGSSTSTQLLQGHGLFEYALIDTGAFSDAVPSAASLNATGTLTNATGLDEVSFKLNSGAVISSVVSVGSGSNVQVFLGGNFTYRDGSSTSANVVAYKKDVVTVAANGGLAGPITSLTEHRGILYAAGAFTATSDGSVTGLGGAAQWAYTVSGSKWTSIGTLPSVGGSIRDLGVVNMGSNDSVVAVGGGGNGLAFFDLSTSQWNASQAGLLIGNLTAFGAAPSISSQNSTVYLAGNVLAASDSAAPGGALLSRSSDGSPKLTSLGYELASTISSSPPSSSSAIASRQRRDRRYKMNMVARAVDHVVAALTPRSMTLEPRAPAAEVNITLPSAISATTTGQVLAGAFWTNGSSDLMLIGGNFATADGVQSLGLYDLDAKTLAPVPGVSIVGAVSSLAVFDKTAWIGGNFTTASGRQGFTTYNLGDSSLDDSEPALQGYAGANATVSVIAQRPGYESTIIIAGAFASAGSLPCQSICSWDTKALQWSSLGGGLQGVVGSISFAGDKSEYLIAAGHFTLGGATSYLAQWHFSNATWTSLGNAADIPGPATAVSSDNSNHDKIFLAGASTAGSPYLLYYNGSRWEDINDGALGSGSGVQQLVFVPVSSSRSSNDIIESNRMLLVSGDLNINDTSVSSALYDGQNWHPYLVSTSSTGAAGVVSQFFYSVTNFSLSNAHHLSVGVVILISIAIALGVVFLLVLIGLLIALARRRDEPQYPPPASGAARQAGDGDSLHDHHAPTALLATVGAATAVLFDGKGEKRSKSADTSPDADQYSIDGGAGAFDGDEDSFGSGDYNDEIGESQHSRARYSFTAEHPGELTVKSGEELTILESNDPNWFLVCNPSGARGLVPASYVC